MSAQYLYDMDERDEADEWMDKMVELDRQVPFTGADYGPDETDAEVGGSELGDAQGADAHVTSTGVLVRSDDGRVYIRKVAGGYGGYKWSFAKGRLEPGLSFEENALKELREEMALEARIIGVLGDYVGDTGTTRFYIGEATGGDTTDLGPETDEVRLVGYEEARQLLNRSRDKQILDDLYGTSADSPPGAEGGSVSG